MDLGSHLRLPVKSGTISALHAGNWQEGARVQTIQSTHARELRGKTLYFQIVRCWKCATNMGVYTSPLSWLTICPLDRQFAVGTVPSLSAPPQSHRGNHLLIYSPRREAPHHSQQDVAQTSPATGEEKPRKPLGAPRGPTAGAPGAVAGGPAPAGECPPSTPANSLA